MCVRQVAVHAAAGGVVRHAARRAWAWFSAARGGLGRERTAGNMDFSSLRGIPTEIKSVGACSLIFMEVSQEGGDAALDSSVFTVAGL